MLQLVDLFQEVGLVRQQQSIFEGLSDLLDSLRLLLDLLLNELAQSCRLGVSILVKLDYPDPEVLERCHSSLQISI